MDWKEIENQLCARVEDLCRYLVPGGHREGGEYVVKSPWREERTASLKINLQGKVGVWCDFGGDKKGQNLIGLWCSVRDKAFKFSIVEAKEWLGIRDDHYRRVQPAAQKKEERPEGRARWSVKEHWPQCEPLHEGGPVWNYLVNIRKLESVVLEAYDVRELVMPGHGPVIVYPYYLPHAKEERSALEEIIVGRRGDTCTRVPTWLKFEALGEKKFWTTDGAQKCLFGMQLLGNRLFKRADHLLIVEGEKDALSWASFGVGHWRVAGSGGVLPVSVPFGAKWKTKTSGPAWQEQRPSPNREWLDRSWEWINDFETVFVGMDSDEPGRKAAADIIGEIGMRRCRLVEMPVHWEEVI